MSRMTPQQSTKLDRLLSEGGTLKAIAEKVGVSASTVMNRKRALKGNGHARPSEVVRNSRGEIMEVLDDDRVDRIADNVLSELRDLRSENARLRRILNIIEAVMEGREE